MQFQFRVDKVYQSEISLALYSEDSPPVEIADRLTASMPHVLQEHGLAQRTTRAIEADYKLVNFNHLLEHC